MLIAVSSAIGSSNRSHTDGTTFATASGAAARCDVLLRGGHVLSVHSGELFEADVAIVGDRIRALTPPGGTQFQAEADLVDARGLVIAPGYVDAHMHVESSFLTPAVFADCTLPRGTTTVLADPHEIVNVAGSEAMRWMIAGGTPTAQSMFWAVPSCVPSLDGLETSGARLDATDVEEMLDWPGVLTLAEVMDFRAVVNGDPRMLSVVGAATRRGLPVDGHCPNLSGADLNEYLWVGIDSDHCKNDVEVALEKARLGMTLMLQEKCLSPGLVSALLELPLLPAICLVTDDIAVDVILDHGHLDHIARTAVRAGLPVLEAMRAITLNPARRLRLYDRGTVAPGKRADLVLLRDLADFIPEIVIAGGEIAARNQRSVRPTVGPIETAFAGTVRLAPFMETFRWRVDLPDGRYAFRAIAVNSVDTYTEAAEIELPVRDGVVDWEGVVTLLVVHERHTGSRRWSAAPVVGFELGRGALATTYAHDSHNLTVIGTSAEDMRHAANVVIGHQGGICVVDAGRVAAHLPLPIGGVMSDRAAQEVATSARGVRAALHAWGWRHANPLMSVSTLTLPVSPHLKLTDLGVINVLERRAAEGVVPIVPS